MRSHEPVMFMLMAFLLVLVNTDEISVESECRDVKSSIDNQENNRKTKCTVTESHADCSCLDLDHIPDDLPLNLTSLNLRGNSIVTINGSVLRRYKGLQNLSLSDNSLHVIRENDFKGLTVLERLDLSLNKIRYDNVNPHAFKELRSLTYLDLKQKRNISRTPEYPHSLVHLKSLRYLMIDGIDCQFPTLPTLKELYLSGQYGNCKIPFVRTSIFNKMTNIRKLYISNCSVLKVEMGAFGQLMHLESLDLSWNTGMTLKPMSNITSGLHSKRFKRLNLNNVYQYYKYDSCTTFSVDNIRYLNNTSVEMVTLEGNSIISVEPDTVSHIPRTLKYVSMSDNILKLGAYTDLMIKYHLLNHLVYYDNSKMFKSHIPPDIKDNDDTGVSPCDPYIACGTMFTRDQIKTYFEVIDARLMKFNITPVGSQKYVSGLKQYKTEYLDISDCPPDIYKLIFKLFGATESLLYLNMSGAYLGYELFDSSTLFDTFVRLTTLDVSRSGIIQLQSGIFDKLVHIERLYLGYNKISNITFNLHLLSKLTYLDLRFNQLEILHRRVREALDILQNVTVNIVGNVLKCYCNIDSLHFLQWLHSTSVTIESIRQTKCVFKNGTLIVIPDLDFDRLKLECEPPTFDTLILVTSLCILTFIIVLFGGLIYRYRWNLRYMYYMTKFKVTGGYLPLDQACYEKDIFVSFADSDSVFVLDHVIPQLEEYGHLSLLIHTRDFKPGEFVTDNIIKAISSTRRTLVILTPAYIESKWCMYEMNIARLEGIETNRSILCVVMICPVPVNKMPIEMIDTIRSQTYIDYPKSAEDQREFWERLRATLK